MKRNIMLVQQAWRQTRWPDDQTPEPTVDSSPRAPATDLAIHNGLGLLLREQRRLRRTNPHPPRAHPCSAWDRLLARLTTLDYASWHAHLAGIRPWPRGGC